MLSAVDSSYYVLNFASIPEAKDLTNSQILKATQKGLEELKSIGNLYICHATSFFPENGILYPRGTLSGPLHPQLKEIQEMVRQLFCICRPTIHFSLNSLVSEHQGYEEDNQHRFIVIDKLENAQDLSGGYIEDLFCIGPYTLSNQATILVPSSCKNEYKEKIQKLNRKINFYFYKGNEKNGFNTWMKERQISILHPIEEDCESTNLLGIVGKQHYLSSQFLLQTINKTFCTHDITPMAQVEKFIRNQVVTIVPPFLNILIQNNYNDLCQKITDYVITFDQVYKINEKQKCFIHSYKKAVFLAFNIFNSSKNINQLKKIFNYYKEAVVQHEKTFNLSGPVDCSSADELSKIVQLPFNPFRRENCQTVVDAVWQSELSSEETRELAIGLKLKYSLDFLVEENEGHHFIVLKDLHLKGIVSSISKLAQK